MQEITTFKPMYALTHTPINAYFSKNSDDFVVREIPLYEFSGEGEHLIVEIVKKDMTTQEALRALADFSGVKLREFGYAGLKDKQGMTTQFISLPRKFEANLSNFNHEKMKILNVTAHNNKLRIGHLKGNSFFIRLKKVLPSEAIKLSNAIKKLDEIGYANYFGYQRFGKFGDNAQSGFELLQKGTLNGKRLNNPRMSEFLISAYQSDLFNRWLSKRVEISRFMQDFSVKELSEIYKFFSLDEIKSLKTQKQFYKLISGEVLGHYPHGKCFLCEDIDVELARFNARDITSCGLIVGAKAYKSIGTAKLIEDEIFSQAREFEDKMNCSRRFAWCYLESVKYKYIPENAHFTMEFTLQKGSYATVVLEEILHRDIFE
ncbi:tRNA pseudouridine(13) synthase TruD [Campylobacter sp. faydin G-105]|uniref:tRNA pseudouridine(13) synthase TruD n=1 Tax=Campylobacter anatolicus TaxID=2829105 RepID=UPI001BA059F8|nr:tRNA pseudouridine(13) synthase TruD [Campylobacter anatolicus]MBR8462740.1 tRNA pseudouridine(13) synthase TruD [Campylobacter anatolicus]